MNAKDIVFPIIVVAFSLSPLPSSRLYEEAPPRPKNNDIETHIVVRGKATLVAAFPFIPTPCPINIWSTMLYNAPTSIDIMLGVPNLKRSLYIFS